MSRYVAAVVYQKKIGSMPRKAILAYCAERANDDGSGIWASKVRISKEVECSKRTVIDTLKSFVDEGLMLEVGRRKSPHGYTIEYAINMTAVHALEDAFESPFSVDDSRGANLHRVTGCTPRGEAPAPQEVKPLHPNRPLTVLKPSFNTPNPKEPDLFSAKKAEKPDKILEILSSVLSEKSAIDFIEHRKLKKAKITERAARLIVKKLASCEDPDAAIEQSIMNGWTGVFPDSTKSKGNRNETSSKGVQRARAFISGARGGP